ncbi:hypothetical protein MJO28_014069 [Puccinia striiformis f. sp. tritici]|uniref:Uncharacterized protein n=3 Tax=Puccinia striiformis TaxID=27350 RepID=A0A2S4VUS3_9BASI|nr:hypothetical protein MJO28_014069 [Puccinia striiformis f. sp. tritici]POW06044.1 hypothetical protein PSTT_09251 [Puccinia striiformis]POW13263.1 hypothetical protein PSHT_07804 [Puccinia striiformis]
MPHTSGFHVTTIEFPLPTRITLSTINHSLKALSPGHSTTSWYLSSESQVSFHLLCRSTAENNPLLTPHLISYGPQVKAKTVQWLDDGLTPNEVNTRLDVSIHQRTLA